MSLKKAKAAAVKAVSRPQEKLFYTWEEGDKKAKALALYQAGKAVQKSEPVMRATGTDIFKNILPGGINVRDGYDRWDYDNLRSTEALPILPKHILRKALHVYFTIGIVRNVIDLMADFATQGINLYHPNERIQRFYREWFRRVNGKERSERFMNLFYRIGNVIIKRQTGKIPVNVEEEMRRTKGKTGPDTDIEPAMKLGAREIPWKYTFINPIVVEILAEELALFVGQESFIFSVEIPRSLAKKIANPMTDVEKRLVKQLPKDVRQGVIEGNRYVPLDSDKVRAFYYKRDDWETWAKPMTYSILADLQLLEKMKLADLSALDGAVSSIRVWKLGNIEARILPTEAAINRLAEMLMNNVGGGVMDLVWGPEIDLIETKTDVHHFLGQTKYEPCLTAIYAGLGIPPTMTGEGGAKGGFTNNFISLKTLTERLEYGREQLVTFWQEEIRLVQQAMGFRFPAKIVFDRMTLSDEAAEKKLLMDLWDRGLVSDECIQERFGEEADIEEARIRREERKRRDGLKPPKASPFYDPQQDYGLKKIFAQTGVVTPSEVGVELDESKKGEKSLVDIQGDQQQQQLDHQQKMAEHQQTQTKLDMKKSEQDNSHQFQMEKMQLKHGVHPGQLQKQAMKVGSPGRPKNAKDSKKRKKKVVKPRTAATFFQMLTWAENAQAAISQIAGPAYLKAKGKKTLRELTNEEASSFEQYKFFILCNLQPNQQVDKDVVGRISAGKLELPAQVDKLLRATVAKHVEANGKEPTLEVLRRYQAGVFALWRGEFGGEEQPQAIAAEDTNKVIDVPDIRQRDHYSCGAAASMSVGQYFGVGPKTLPEWKKALGTDVEHSTPPPAIVKYLDSLGLKVQARDNMTLDDLSNAVAAGKPVIVCVQDYGKYIPSKAKFLYGHYLTVIGKIDGYVICQDSSEDNVTKGDQTIAAPGRVLIADETFVKNWHDQDEDGNKYIQFGITVSK